MSQIVPLEEIAAFTQHYRVMQAAMTLVIRLELMLGLAVASKTPASVERRARVR